MWVYSHEPPKLDKLKEEIRDKVAVIDGEMMAHEMVDIMQKLEDCIKEDGHHLLDVIYHKLYIISNGK